MKFFGSFALIALTIISQIQGAVDRSSGCQKIIAEMSAYNDEGKSAFMRHAQAICRAHYQEETQIMDCLCQIFKDKY